MKGPLRARIMARVMPVEDGSGCWLWQGKTDRGGYGHTTVAGQDVRVHRVMYELDVGPIPAGMQIDHVRERGCRHRNCCNPAHLEPVTCRENLFRSSTTQAALNAAKTHCRRGHELPTGSTGGRRRCQPCVAIRTREYRARQRA